MEDPTFVHEGDTFEDLTSQTFDLGLSEEKLAIFQD
jgi:hypothetical protein